MAGKRKPASLGAVALERVLEVTRRLAAPFDLTEMLTLVVDEGRALLKADRGSVFLYDASSHELYTTVATGTKGTIRFSADKGIVGECARTRRLINVADCDADPRFNREVDRATGYRTQCLLTVPLIGHDESLVGVLQVLNKAEGAFTAEDETIAGALAAQCAVALQRVRLLSEFFLKEKMERELALARDIQMRVLPKSMPPVAGYDLTGWSRPADQTGGDIFDAIALDETQVALLLGDATGHGIGPALSVTQVRAMLRIAIRLGASLDAAFGHINDQLAADLADNRFVTAFLGILDATAHRITYHSGGQGPLLHLHAASGTLEWRGASTVPMGFMPRLRLKPAESFDMAPGDIVALITDGIYEAADGEGALFGQERVGEILLRHREEPAPLLANLLLAEVESFTRGAPQGDDMTFLFIKRLAA